MTETLACRQQPSSSFDDRPPSTRSTTGSQRSTSNNYKVSSQSSATALSPGGSHRSSQPPLSNHQHVFQKPAKRPKSQYPLNDTEPHVEYILVASFDIDRGPIMEHQYPGAISPDENMLAELMLPDQTHMRQQDWTMFFLHKDAGNSEEEAAEKIARRKDRQRRKSARQALAAEGHEADQDASDDDDGEEEEDDDDDESLNESPPLMYVLNLVNTKLDSSVKRGSIVKAMAICTRHSFLHIYKPLLLLALEDYMKTPTPDTLELLWNSLNAMDVSMVPRFSLHERHILQASDAKDMFVEKFEHMIAQRQEDEFTGRVARQPESPTRSGAPQYAVPRDTHEFESKIVYNGIPIPVKIPTALSPETVGDFSLMKLIQTFADPHRTQPQSFALHPHLTTSGAFTHPIVVLINAILTQKRVIFLGHNRPSGEVAEAVVAACALGSGGVLRGFTRHAFPYTDLTKIDELLKVPGFIAGVTNPAFSYHPEWWDLMCDLPSGRMKISSNIEPAPITEGTTYFQQQSHGLLSSLQKDQLASDPTGDAHFMEDINRGIASRCGETIIRAKFRAYITKLTRIAAAFEETVYGASNLTVIPPAEVDKGDNTSSSQSDHSSRPMSLRTLGRNVKGHGYVWPSEEAKTRELAASAARIEGWRNTRSYYIFISDLASHTKDPSVPSSPVGLSNILSAQPVKAYLDLYHSLSKLRTLRLTPTEAGAIYLALDAYCTDYDSILELLELTPMSEAGLFHLSLGLWHEDNRVRGSVVNLLDRIRNHPAGRVFFGRLGGWANTGFTMCMQEKEVRAKAQSEGAQDMLAPLSISGRYS